MGGNCEIKTNPPPTPNFSWVWTKAELCNIPYVPVRVPFNCLIAELCLKTLLSLLFITTSFSVIKFALFFVLFEFVDPFGMFGVLRLVSKYSWD